MTGSATGIGRAVAWRFAERGFAVTVNYSRSKAEAEETADGVRQRGAKVLVVAANVADDAAVRAMVERIGERAGRARRAGQQRRRRPTSSRTPTSRGSRRRSGTTSST